MSGDWFRAPAGPMAVTVAGAGAIGLTLAARLGLAGHAVSVLARGATRAAIAANGVTLEDLDGVHTVAVTIAEPGRTPAPDLLVLAVKAQDLPKITTVAAPFIGPDTRILPLVNGIPWWLAARDPAHAAAEALLDPEGVLARLIPAERIIGAVTFITAERTAPSVARTFNPMKLVIGPAAEGASLADVDALAGALEGAGISAEATPRIADMVWLKAVNNLSTNPLSVVTGETLEGMCAGPPLREIVTGIVTEARDVAAACGAEGIPPAEALVTVSGSLGPVRTSMLQDYEAGLPLELAAIGDAVVALGAVHGVAMPRTATILDLARFRMAARRAAVA